MYGRYGAPSMMYGRPQYYGGYGIGWQAPVMSQYQAPVVAAAPPQARRSLSAPMNYTPAVPAPAASAQSFVHNGVTHYLHPDGIYRRTPPNAPAPSSARATPPSSPTKAPQPKDEGPFVLYLARVSANCHGPWILLKESGLQFEIKDVDLMKGESRTPEFLAMNPMHQVPTLRDPSGFAVFEGNTIMRYICNKHDLTKFYPANSAARAHVDMALDWKLSSLYPVIAKLTYPALGFSKDILEGDALKAARNELDSLLSVLTDYFMRDEAPFIGGLNPCIADFAIVASIKLLEVTDYKKSDKVVAYLDRFNTAVKSFKTVASGDGGFGLDAYMAMKNEEGKK